MQKITFDTGIEDFDVNGIIMRFNPCDPNLYARFWDFYQNFESEIHEMTAVADAPAENELEEAAAVMKLTQQIDKRLKSRLTEVFGPQNNFDEAAGGVNMAALGSNGNWVVLNLMEALLPILQEGTQKYADTKISQAVSEAKLNRAQRRAQP